MTEDRPDTVPSYAEKVGDQWADESDVAGKFRRQLWTADGGMLRIEFWTADQSELISLRTYFDAGVLLLELDEGWGSIERWAYDATIADGYPTFPHKKVKSMEFRTANVDVSDPQHPTFEASDPLYLDLREEPLTAEGERTEDKPAWRIAVDQGEALDDPQEERDGAWATYHDDDTPELEAIYEDGALESVTWSNAAGEIVYQRTYGGTEVVEVFGSEGVLTFTRTPTGRALVLKSYVGEELLSRTCDLAAIATAEDFAAAYVSFFGDLDEHFDLRGLDFDIVLAIDGFDIELADVRREDEFFNVAAVAEGGGGDSLIVIEEPGPFEGRVFINLHDEGLYDIETIDDYFEGVDAEALTDRNGLIEDMPFFYNDVADSLREAFARIDIAPYDEPDFDSMQPAHHGTAP